MKSLIFCLFGGSNKTPKIKIYSVILQRIWRRTCPGKKKKTTQIFKTAWRRRCETQTREEEDLHQRWQGKALKIRQVSLSSFESFSATKHASISVQFVIQELHQTGSQKTPTPPLVERDSVIFRIFQIAYWFKVSIFLFTVHVDIFFLWMMALFRYHFCFLKSIVGILVFSERQ